MPEGDALTSSRRHYCCPHASMHGPSSFANDAKLIALMIPCCWLAVDLYLANKLELAMQFIACRTRCGLIYTHVVGC